MDSGGSQVRCGLAVTKASHVLGCVSKSAASSQRIVFLSLYSAVVKSHLKYYIWCSVVHEKNNILPQVQERIAKMIRGLEHMT